MDLRRISDPLTIEQKLAVVSLDSVKAQARIRHTEEDGLVKDHIAAAFDHLHGSEGWTNGYCLIEEEFEVYLDAFSTAVELPVRPVIDLDGIEVDVLGAAGDYAAAQAGSFTVVRSDGFAVVASLSRSAFDRTGLDASARAYRIRFKAGHVDAGETPTPLKQSILMLAAHFYSNREATLNDARASGVSREVEFGLLKLAGRYRVSPDHS